MGQSSQSGRRAAYTNIALGCGISLLVVACSAENPVQPANNEHSFANARIVKQLSAPMLPSVQDGYVLTPYGRFHRSCTRALLRGERVDLADRKITRADGSSFRHPPCAFPSFPGRSRGRSVEVPNDGSVAVPYTGWLDFAGLTSTSFDPFRNIVAHWKVPDAPSGSYGSSGKVYYTFPGLQSLYRSGGDAIYQPVLQYGNNGAFGGAYWRIATWICAPSSCYYSTPISASVGDSITGDVSFSACFAGCYTSVVAVNNTSSATTYMFGSAYGDPDDMQFAMASVEVYGVTACSDLPANGVYYTGVSLTKASGAVSNPNWFTVPPDPNAPGAIPSCNITAGTSSTTISLLHNY